MEDWGKVSRAKHLLVFHGSQFLTSYNGKGFKTWGKTIKSRGYDTHTWYIDASRCGASIWSKYVATFCFPLGSQDSLPPQLGDNVSVRPCRNLIRTYGVHPSNYHPTSALTPSTSPSQTNLIGTIFGHDVYHWDGPCGGGNPSWILVPEFGVRKLLEDELLKLKGATLTRFDSFPPAVLHASIEQHVWATICQAIAPTLLSTPPSSPPLIYPPSVTPSLTLNHHLRSKWSWSMIDLEIGKDFYIYLIGQIKVVVKTLVD